MSQGAGTLLRRPRRSDVRGVLQELTHLWVTDTRTHWVAFPMYSAGTSRFARRKTSLRSHPRVTAARSARFERQPAWQAPFDVIHSPWITRNERAARVAPLDFKRSESACFAGRRSPNTSGTPLPCANSPDPRPGRGLNKPKRRRYPMMGAPSGGSSLARGRPNGRFARACRRRGAGGHRRPAVCWPRRLFALRARDVYNL